MAKETSVTIHRNERILAFMIAAIILVSVVAFVAVVIAGFSGVKSFDGGLWPSVVTLPYVGFPIALLLMIVLLILSIRRRSREARNASK